MQQIILLSLFFIAVTSTDVTSKISKYSLQQRKPEKVSDINADFEEFVNLLPKREIQGIFKAYVDKDKEVNLNWNYIHSAGFQKLLSNIAISAEYNAVRTDLVKAGLNAEKFLVLLEELFVWNSQSIRPAKISTGLRGMLMDNIRPLFPMQKFKLLSTQKFVFSSQFRKMIALITSKSFKQKMSLWVKSRPVRDLEEDASLRGVHIEAIYEFIASFKTLYNYLMEATL